MYNSWEELIKVYLEGRPNVSELTANGDSDVFLRESGKRVKIAGVFKSEEEYIRLTTQLAKIIDSECGDNPEFLVEGKYKFGDGEQARVHIMFPPACETPQVTIARKSQQFPTLDAIQDSHSMNESMKNFIRACTISGATIVLSGSTGAGKTMFMEAMMECWPKNLRVGVVEDIPELNLSIPNTTYLHSSVWKPGLDTNEVATLDWCVAQMNRMRVDRLVIGEVRGKEFMGFILAANSGSAGSCCTLHANSPQMALQKMAQFIMMAQEQDIRVVNQSIATTVDLIIQLTKYPDGRYRVSKISELSAVLGASSTANIPTADLFTYNEATDSWDNKSYNMSTGLRAKLVAHNFDTTTFTPLNGASSVNAIPQNTNAEKMSALNRLIRQEE